MFQLRHQVLSQGFKDIYGDPSHSSHFQDVGSQLAEFSVSDLTNRNVTPPFSPAGPHISIGIFEDSWGKMWSREGDSDGGSTRRGRVKFFPIGVNSANIQKAIVLPAAYTKGQI
jgi:hypothetical protein